MKIVASSLCNFILVDCCIVASFLDLVKNTVYIRERDIPSLAVNSFHRHILFDGGI
jgi:hypothetical protein